jgi:hypothetical protein
MIGEINVVAHMAVIEIGRWPQMYHRQPSLQPLYCAVEIREAICLELNILTRAVYQVGVDRLDCFSHLLN